MSPGLIASYTRITRGSVLSIALATASISTHPLLWIFLPLAVVVLVATPHSPRLSKPPRPRFILLAGVSAWVLTVPKGPLSLFSATVWLPETSLWVTLAAIALLLTLVPVIVRGRLPLWAWILVGIWVVASATASVLADPETWVDVWALHGQAGDTLLAGGNPYSELTVPNPMSQFPDGSVYEGYVYPPSSLVTFALGHALTGDSRWFAVLCGVGLVLTFRLLSRSSETDSLALMFLVSPGWPLMTQLAWTEVLSVLLLAMAFLGRADGRIRPALIGLFIGSKQYLLFSAVPVLASWWRRRSSALLIAGTVAVAAYASGLVFGPGYIEWGFLFHLRVPPPPLADNIPGLAELLLGIEFHIPSWLSILSGLSLGGWVASREPRNDSSLLLAIAATLTPIFLFGYQAFPNYWYGVVGIFVIALVVGGQSPRTTEEVRSDPHVVNAPMSDGQA